MEYKHLGIRIDPHLHYKLRYIASYEGRSISGQVLYSLRQSVQAFEAKHGEIKENPPKETEAFL